MRNLLLALCLMALTRPIPGATSFNPAPQQFDQEVAQSFTQSNGLPDAPIQLLDQTEGSSIRAFASGRWHELNAGRWNEIRALRPGSTEFIVPDHGGKTITVPLPWREVIQICRHADSVFLATTTDLFSVVDGKFASLGWPSRYRINQIAVSPEGALTVASNDGLFRQHANGWTPIAALDATGRAWGVKDVLGVGYDSKGQLWFGTKAGAACLTGESWSMYEGKDGVPWTDFTGITAGPKGELWFGTHLGAIRFDDHGWHYRQGPRWLPHDDVTQVLVDSAGTAWFATPAGVGQIRRDPMTLAEKAERYEAEIEKYIKRTPLGYVAEAHLTRPSDRSSADPQDSDNDGLWTAMYGAGEALAYGATGDPKAKRRAAQAFEALRFLQTVTQGGNHAPPPGYVARTIRSIDLPDPNVGRLEQDINGQKSDQLWKAYEPRWPKSADGKWYWKSDTSSDELDGHYFFYALYYDLCADTQTEKDRVRDVVRALTDHLVEHQYVLMDHDGKPTRWAIYGPQFLNRDPRWWPERGLNSLSLLSYLSVASHVTGDAKYDSASRDLIDRHGYAHNAMYPKVQQGPGSGNQSDDEMAFMCYYSLLRCSNDEALKGMVRYSFFRYWLNEAPEMNPFFNFSYAAINREARVTNVWGTFPMRPWAGWLEDSMGTLRGFPLDRLNWPHRNSHRLDLVALPSVRSQDLDSPDSRIRGHRINGKVLPVENRHFTHWNTDPWRYDYGGNGNELAAGTAYLLPYYMGLYHGFIEKPTN